MIQNISNCKVNYVRRLIYEVLSIIWNDDIFMLEQCHEQITIPNNIRNNMKVNY